LVLVIIVVFLIAVAQVLMVHLTIRREEEIKELDRLVEEQRLQVGELKTWLGRRYGAQPVLQNLSANQRASHQQITLENRGQQRHREA
jgi:sirohydrochlorin ferrochelatase